MTGPTAEAVPAPRIRRLAPVPVAKTPPSIPNGPPVRSMHLNESPFPPAPAVVAAMQEAVTRLNRYPDHDGLDLVHALSVRLGVPESRIVIGGGTNELLSSSGEIALDLGDEAIAPDPGFVTYAKITGIQGGVFLGVPVRDDGAADVDAILAAVTPRTRLVYVASPNNPTGGMLTAAEIERLIAHLPDHLLLHFDEAYYEFGRHAGGPETLPLLQKRSGPWIATRSFSKAYGLAGARVGYGITGTDALAEAYRKVRANFTVNAVALAGARAALDEEAHVTALLDHTARERERLNAALTALGFKMLKSAANFVAGVPPRPAGEVAAKLREAGIFVLPFPMPGSDGALRITIGTKDDDDALVAALDGLLARV